MLLAVLPASLCAQIQADPIGSMIDTTAIKNNVITFDSTRLATDTSLRNANPKIVVTDSDGDTLLVRSDTTRVTDTVVRSAKIKERKHSPTLAALLSAALPGLGQGYNKKYWKIPIVYAGVGGLGFAVGYTAVQWKGFRNAYRLQVDEDPTTYGSYKGQDNANTLKEYRDFHKRNLDIFSICLGVWYLLNVVDAAVDAHLFHWNMKDDINLSWTPTMIQGGPYGNTTTAGLSVRLGF